MAKREPLRMCIVCRTMKPKRELFRIVVQDEEVRLDRTGRSQGRGAYICRSEECVTAAEKQHRAERALHRKTAAELYHELQQALPEAAPAAAGNAPRRVHRLTADQKARLISGSKGKAEADERDGNSSCP